MVKEGVLPNDVAKVKQEIREIILTKTPDEGVAIFNETDACIEPVMTLTEKFNDSMAGKVRRSNRKGGAAQTWNKGVCSGTVTESLLSSPCRRYTIIATIIRRGCDATGYPL